MSSAPVARAATKRRARGARGDGSSWGTHVGDRTRQLYGGTRNNAEIAIRRRGPHDVVASDPGDDAGLRRKVVPLGCGDATMEARRGGGARVGVVLDNGDVIGAGAEEMHRAEIEELAR